MKTNRTWPESRIDIQLAESLLATQKIKGDAE